MGPGSTDFMSARRAALEAGFALVYVAGEPTPLDQWRPPAKWAVWAFDAAEKALFAETAPAQGSRRIDAQSFWLIRGDENLVLGLRRAIERTNRDQGGDPWLFEECAPLNPASKRAIGL